MPIPIPDRLTEPRPITQWSADAVADKLTELYEEAIRLSDATIQWYHKYRSRKGWWARSIRLVAIVLFILSTLVPYIASVKDGDAKTDWLYTGYILAGVGAGLLLLDRYYGFTNSWIRFVLTGMDLENLRNAFVHQWQAEYVKRLPINRQRFAELINILLKYQEGFQRTVKAETKAWASEFQQSFIDLSGALKSQSDSLKADIQASTNRPATDGPAPEAADASTARRATPEVMETAVRTASHEWAALYGGPFESIGVARKQVGGSFTGELCIQFDVKEKKLSGDLARWVPDFIPYEHRGKTYLLPTDVVGVGETVLTGYEPKLQENYFTGHGTTPRQPGLGCSRQGTQSTGTIGMLVRSNTNPSKTYLLSCYHVLCSPELERGIMEVDGNVQDPYIISPGTVDDVRNPRLNHVIGKVERGLLDDGDAIWRGVDAAIAEVYEDTVRPEIFNLKVAPTTGVVLISDHAANGYPVRMIGRTSCFQQGSVSGHYINKSIAYPTPGNPNRELTMCGVIKTTKICAPGDSGALVLDERNRAIGLAFASDEEFTFIIPYHAIFKRLNLNFYIPQ